MMPTSKTRAVAEEVKNLDFLLICDLKIFIFINKKKFNSSRCFLDTNFATNLGHNMGHIKVNNKLYYINQLLIP